MGRQVATAQQATQNWSAQMANPATAAKYSAGIDRVNTSPMAAAAANLQNYLRKVTDAVNSGRMAAALNASDFAAWKAQAKNYGAQNLAKGAAKGAGKYAKKAQALQQVWQAASDAAHAIPKGDFNAAQARWAAAVQVMMAAKGKV